VFLRPDRNEAKDTDDDDYHENYCTPMFFAVHYLNSFYSMFYVANVL